MSLQSQNPTSKSEQLAAAGYIGRDTGEAHLHQAEEQNSNATTLTPKSYSTTASISTKATSTENTTHQVPPVQPNLTPTFPPPDPLTLGFGAQFADQVRHDAPPTSQQQEADRRARMGEFQHAFASLGVYLPHPLLEQVENARYGVMAPRTVLAQLAARYRQEDPKDRWLAAEDTWNTWSRQLRERLPEVGTLHGWDELEALPDQE